MGWEADALGNALAADLVVGSCGMEEKTNKGSFGFIQKTRAERLFGSVKGWQVEGGRQG